MPQPSMATPKEIKKASKCAAEEKIGTVPPNNHHGLKKTSRSRQGKSRKVSGIRKGIKPLGENGTIRQGKLDMKRMFAEKKLLRGAVPQPTTATPTEMTRTRLLRGAVPQPATATPTKMTKTRLLWGAMPAPTTATPTEMDKKRLLWGAVLPKHSKLESGPVPPRNIRRKPKIAEEKKPGELNRNEVIVSRSTIVKRRGNILQVQKSTKGAEISNKVSEIRKIWENKKLEKSEIRPGSSANKPICVESMGGQILPTVLDRPTAPKGRD